MSVATMEKRILNLYEGEDTSSKVWAEEAALEVLYCKEFTAGKIYLVHPTARNHLLVEL